MCVRAHNLLRPPKWKSWIRPSTLCSTFYTFCECLVSLSQRKPSYARQKDANAHVILPGAHRARHMHRTFDTCFTLSLIYNLYVLFVWSSYQARFGLKISYPAIVFTMVIGLLNCGSFIVHILLLGTSKVFTLSVFLPCACVHVLLPGTRLWS